MSGTIVVGHDGSDTSTNAVIEAGDLAEALDSRLHVVSAFKRDATTVEHEGESWVIGGVDQAERVVQDAASRFKGRIEVTTSVIEGDPARALVDEAKRLDASMIVVGNLRTQGISRILGSVASGVMRHAPCSVHVAHTSG